MYRTTVSIHSIIASFLESLALLAVSNDSLSSLPQRNIITYIFGYFSLIKILRTYVNFVSHKITKAPLHKAITTMKTFSPFESRKKS